MHARQNRLFRFADADQLHRHLLSHGTTDAPVSYLHTRGQWTDTFGEASAEEAYAPSGASRYLKPSQPDRANWVRFLLLHRNAALKLVPPDTRHDAVRAAINKLFDDNSVHAVTLDNHESPTLRHEAPTGDRLREATGKTTEIQEPMLVKVAIEKMYEAAQGATGEVFPLGPGIVVPHFGPTNGDQMGTWASIEFRIGDSFPEGSSAKGSYTKIPWEGRLAKRRTPVPGRRNVYIRGHLLNDHLGGPAAAYNLVPLVGVDVIGAPNTNGAHSNVVEGQARSAFKRMSSPDLGSSSPTGRQFYGIRYFVSVASFGGHDAAHKIAMEIKEEQLRLKVHLARAAAHLNVDAGTITIAQFKTYLGLGSDDPRLLMRYAEEWSYRSKLYLQTVCDTDNGTLRMVDVLALLGENVELWQFEAKALPSTLVYTFESFDLYGKAIDKAPKTVPIPAGPVHNRFMVYDPAQ